MRTRASRWARTVKTWITAPARLKVPLMRTLTSRIRCPGCVVVATTAAGSDVTIAGDGLLVVLANGAGATGELGATGSEGVPVDEDVGVGSPTGGGVGVDGGSGGGGAGGAGGAGGVGGVGG